MLVRNWMSKDVITVDVNDSMQDAIKLLREHKIRRLPVMEKNQLVGIVTELNLEKAAGFENHLSPTKIRDIMVKDLITVPYDHTIEEAAEVLLLYSISGVPVVNEQERMVGIITKTDIFKYIVTLAGARKKGVQLAVELADRPENVNEITGTIRDYGVRISNFLSTQRRARNGYRKVYIHVNDIDRPTLLRLKEILKEKTNLLYIVNHMDRTREIF